MKELIKALSDCDYSKSSVESIYHLFVEHLHALPITEMTIKKERIIYRVRPHDIEGSFTQHTSKSEVFCRTDLNSIQSYGRCNTPLSAGFYGCISSSEIEEGYVPSVMETTNMCDRPDRPSQTTFKEGYERYSLGMWKLNQDIKVMVIPPRGTNVQNSKINDILSDKYDSLVDSKNMTKYMRKLYSILGREFSKDMIDMPNHHYAISAMFSQIVLGPDLQGIAYPSVRAYQKAFNIVLTPGFAMESLDLHRVGVIEYFKVKNKSHFRNLYYADVSDGEPFNFKKVPKGETSSLIEVKNYYLNQGISEGHITQLFKEQNIHE